MKINVPRFDMSYIPPDFATASYRLYLVQSAKCQADIVKAMAEQARTLESLYAWARSQGWTG